MLLSADSLKVVLDVTSLGNPTKQVFLVYDGKGGYD